ncbi:uncharacterized protein LOC143034466 [Oratosquilla oratoria]|uniref:uncharacterized protein LOC143034466 n=1 Tax=Oratosquilla oratoria TaxID=337810 RepID=UPI003F76848E
MRSLTYSWIGLSAASPLVFLMCAWVLGVFHSYRRQWRSVDLFLLAVFVQELLMALQVFAYALLSLVRPESNEACAAFVWALSATRTLQAATLTSLLVDRALTNTWPYKYRFSVRRHQIRYHLAVLATVAVLVGVAALLARTSIPDPATFDLCNFLPYALDIKLSLFVLSVYVLLVVVAGVSIGVVTASRGCGRPGSGGRALPSPPPSDLSPITQGATTASSTTSSSAGRGPLTKGGTALHHTTSTASSSTSASSMDLAAPPPPPPHRPPLVQHRSGPKAAAGATGGPQRPSAGAARPSPACDFRWSTAVAVASLCFLINHLPYLGLTVVGTFFSTYLPEWPSDNLALWLSLAEGLLLPLLLGLVDSTFSEAAGASCSRDRQQRRCEEGEGPFRLFGVGREDVKSFPLTNGSLFSSLLNMNVDHAGHPPVPSYRRGVNGGGLRMGVSCHEIRGLVSNGANEQLRERGLYSSSLLTTATCESLGSGTSTNTNDPIYSAPLTKVPSVESCIKLADEDHIYATLSETFGSMSSLSESYLPEEQRCSSATTVANDDFEFHDPRSPGTPNAAMNTVSSGTTTTSSSSCSSTDGKGRLSRRPPAGSQDDMYHLSTGTASTTLISSASDTSSSSCSSLRSSASQATTTLENATFHNDQNKDFSYTNPAFESDTLDLKKKYMEEDLKIKYIEEDLEKKYMEKVITAELHRTEEPEYCAVIGEDVQLPEDVLPDAVPDLGPPPPPRPPPSLEDTSTIDIPLHEACSNNLSIDALDAQIHTSDTLDVPLDRSFKEEKTLDLDEPSVDSVDLPNHGKLDTQLSSSTLDLPLYGSSGYDSTVYSAASSDIMSIRSESLQENIYDECENKRDEDELSHNCGGGLSTIKEDTTTGRKPQEDEKQQEEEGEDSEGRSPRSRLNTLSRQHRTSSLSMNDLDRLDGHGTSENEEMMFVLPVRSESLLSLYRLYLADEEEKKKEPKGYPSLQYSMEISRSEGDLSLLASGFPPCSLDSSSSSGRLDASRSSLGPMQEIYTRRKAPDTSGSRVKRQHKIQRAKGMQQQQKARMVNSASSSTRSAGSFGNGPSDGSLQVTIVDKARRRNGIVTIRDPSVLSVEELFRVLDRAASPAAKSPAGAPLPAGAPQRPYADTGGEAGQSPASLLASARSEPDFKKIFVSEYI